MTPNRIVLCALLLAAAGTPARSAPRTLYEKLAFGRTVILGTCIEQGRFAHVDVNEVLKGDLEFQRIQIAYRLANMGRASLADDKIAWSLGQRSILILVPDETEDGRVREADRFLLDGSDDGKVDVPEEGADALLQAVRRMLEIQRIADQEEQWEAQRELLDEINPHLVEAGFQEVLKFRLGRPGMLSVLDRYLTHPRDSFRLDALRVLAQILEAAARRGQKVDGLETIGGDLLAVLRGDAVAEVRAEAVRTARLTGREDLPEVLREAARSDPAQRVRYEAQVALKDLRSAPSAPPPAEP
jgi:hypothetical protein